MMRTSNLLRWAHNNKNGNNNSKNKNWIHPPEALLQGHIAYLVKFLGSTEVDQPKGIEVVKEGIRKLRFSQQLRKAEGQKTPKIELTVSVDGVAIQEPKVKRILHQYPLHRISYCADDKAEKKFFSFIAKEADSDKHTCYVFVSDKLAEEITLTIGQAFDLAYRRFLETTGRDAETRRQAEELQDKVQRLQRQNGELRRRLQDLSTLVDAAKLREFLALQGITDVLDMGEDVENGHSDNSESTNGNGVVEAALINLNGPMEELKNPTVSGQALPPVPPRNFENPKNDGKENRPDTFLLESDDDFDPRSENSNTAPVPMLSPPPIKPRNHVTGKDIFGAEPFTARPASDPFGMDDFGLNLPTTVHGSISEMREGFSRGIAFGGDSFSIESLDPLRT